MELRGRPVLLLVEDHADVRRTLVRLLSGSFAVIEAASLPQALAVLEGTATIDIIWSDLDLAGRPTGIDVLRAGERAHPDAVLMLVTSTPDAEATAALPAGVLVFDKRDAAAAVAALASARAAGSCQRV